MPADDRPTFEAEALPHLDAVYRLARRLCRNDHEAEDLVQETFLRAQQAYSRFELRSFGIKPWLFRILHNVFLNRSERERRAPRATDQGTLDQYTGPAGGGDAGPPQLDYEHLDGEVKRAIDGLPPEFRSVILLWATMEVSYQEIADILAIPVGTVMSRLHRARSHLARVLRDYARDHRLADSQGNT